MSMRHFLVWFSSLLLFQYGVTWANICPDNQVSLLVNTATDNFGQPQIKAHLGDIHIKDIWDIKIDLTTTECLSGKPQRYNMTVSLAGVLGLSPQNLAPPEGYTTLSNFGHYKMPNEALNWEAAKKACEDEGAHLAVLNSQDEVDVLRKNFTFSGSGATRTDLIFLGYSDLKEEGHFVSVLGDDLEDLGYKNWVPGQPAGKTTENCLSMWKSNGLLEDIPCHWMMPFICEIPLK